MEDSPSPQLCAVGEEKRTEFQPNQDAKQSYASQLVRQSYVAAKANLELCPVTVENGIPTIEFTVEEVNTFTKEEGLQQAVVIKFSYGKPELQELRQILPKQLEVKGNCNIGQLEYRHILVRFDLFEDFANVVSRTTGYVKAKGDDFFFRTFPWTMRFNPREETSKAVVWISFPELPANFFAKKSLMSIATAVGKPISVDKATKDRTRPSTARVKVLINLLDKHPQKVKIKIVDTKSGKIIEYDQRIVFDNLPKYCTCCNHQGHDVKSCRWNTNELKEQAMQSRHSEDRGNLIKLKGDAREFLNANRDARNKEKLLPGLNNVAGGPTESKDVSDQMEQIVEVPKICQFAPTVPSTVNDPSDIVVPKDSDAAVENNTELVTELQMHPASNVGVSELQTKMHTDLATVQSNLNAQREHMVSKQAVAAADQTQVDQNVDIAHFDIVSLKLNSQTEIVQSENTVASVEKGLNPSIRTEPIHDQQLHTASAGVDLQALDQATDESVSKQELDQAKSVINSPDKEQGECSAKEKKEASPKTKDRKKFQFEENKALPSVSNSFDVLANADDDERTNMGLKSCHSQTSSQKSEAKNASHAKDTILQTRSNLKSISDHKVPKRAKSSKPKLWKDQGDYDDDETWGEGLASFSWEEEDQGSGEDSEDSIEQKIERKIANKNSRAKANQTATSNRRLNHNAPVYVPANNVKAVRSFEGTSTVNNNDRHLNSAEDSVDDRFATQKPSTNHHTNQKHSIDVNTVDMSQAKQLVTADSVISSEEKQSLEVIVNTETNIVTGSSVLNSQELPKISCAGTHIYEEGEEEDFINQCRADASIKGDLSPMHSARIKKSHQRERSWDGNMVEVRKPPMRNAKQKQAAQTNFPKSNRLKNKS